MVSLRDRLCLIADDGFRPLNVLAINGVNKIIDGHNRRTLEIGKRKSVSQVVISGMEQIKAVEQTRLPPPFTHSDADAARSEKLESRLFKIGMARNISSKVLHPGNERMI